MKRIGLLILALLLLLTLCSCKSEKVKSVEAMIEDIGDVTADSLQEIESVMESYDDLSEEDKEKVENYDALADAYDACLEQMLIGEWVYEPRYFYNVHEEMYDKVDVTLNEDMTAEGDYMSGIWRVEDGELRIKNGEYDSLYYIDREEDKVYIGFPDNKMMRKEEYTALLDEMFVTVELTEENIADYCGIIIYTKNEEDDFGVLTGDTNTYATLESKVFEDGLIFMEESDDMAIELLIPAHKYKLSVNNGKKWRSFKQDAESAVIDYGPYGTWGCSLGYKMLELKCEAIHNITADQITFGRVKGTLTFIREEFVDEIKKGENGSRQLVLYNGEEIYGGMWYENLNY